MDLKQLKQMIDQTLVQYGNGPATILRSEGRKFIEIEISGIVVMTDDSGKMKSVIVDDGELVDAMPKVTID